MLVHHSNFVHAEENRSSESDGSDVVKIQSIELDESGCPLLPVELHGGLTVYSTGEVCTMTSMQLMMGCLEI